MFNLKWHSLCKWEWAALLEMGYIKKCLQSMCRALQAGLAETSFPMEGGWFLGWTQALCWAHGLVLCHKESRLSQAETGTCCPGDLWEAQMAAKWGWLRWVCGVGCTLHPTANPQPSLRSWTVPHKLSNKSPSLGKKNCSALPLLSLHLYLKLGICHSQGRNGNKSIIIIMMIINNYSVRGITLQGQSCSRFPNPFIWSATVSGNRSRWDVLWIWRGTESPTASSTEQEQGASNTQISKAERK